MTCCYRTQPKEKQTPPDVSFQRQEKGTRQKETKTRKRRKRRKGEQSRHKNETQHYWDKVNTIIKKHKKWKMENRNRNGNGNGNRNTNLFFNPPEDTASCALVWGSSSTGSRRAFGVRSAYLRNACLFACLLLFFFFFPIHILSSLVPALPAGGSTGWSGDGSTGDSFLGDNPRERA